MRRKEFRPRAVRGSSLRSRGAGRPGFRPRTVARGRKLRSRLLIVGGVIVVAAVAWVGVQLLRPVPSMVLTARVTTVRVLPGVAPSPDWPGQAQAAVGLPGIGLLGTHGGSAPVPIASLAKIMTAYVVLGDHPLPAAGSGPAITVTAADVAAYASGERQGQSVVRVAAGEKLTERQALEAMLIPSGNNIASMLASWDAGSDGAFVAKMNARAGSLGLRGTRYADASGADPATVSTAGDQFRLTLRALQIPAFRQIVAMPQVTLPVAGVAYNVNSSPRARRDRGRQDRLGRAGGRVPGLRCHPGGRGQPGNDRRRRAGRTGNLRPAERPWRRDFRRRDTSSAASAGTWSTPRSSGPEPSSGACPARGPPGPPRSRPPGSA